VRGGESIHPSVRFMKGRMLESRKRKCLILYSELDGAGNWRPSSRT
jgi:hypothetical protein